MDTRNFIIRHLEDSIRTKERIIEQCIDSIQSVANVMTDALNKGHKILLCGNGGSAADSQHLAAELVIRLSHEVVRPGLPAIALNTDTSILTAGGNDIGFSNVFARQIEALGQAGDILIGISTSGNSENILKALHTAGEKGLQTIGFLGGNGGKAAALCDHSIIIPSENVQHIQEAHITVGHIIIELVERKLFNS
jgi:D-sedoheptulose 7-phosphate isomerase